jgi:hypothetical protein
MIKAPLKQHAKLQGQPGDLGSMALRMMYWVRIWRHGNPVFSA